MDFTSKDVDIKLGSYKRRLSLARYLQNKFKLQYEKLEKERLEEEKLKTVDNIYY